MTYEQLIESMTPDMHVSLKRAVEIGKWPDGRRLTPEQREICMRAVIAYDLSCKPEDERVGFIDRRKPDGTVHGSDPLEPQILKVLGDA